MEMKNNFRKDETMKEIAVLVLEIMLLVLKGLNIEDAVKKTADKSGVGFCELWKFIPDRWK